MGAGRLARGGKRQGAGPGTGEGQQELEPDQIIRNCEAALKTPETDWDAIYLRLRCSALGDDFPRERFLRTPIRAVVRCLEYIDSEEQRQFNLAASTTAKLCMQVISIAHGMSGSRSRPPKLELKAFLPFPDWSPETANPEGPSVETKTILTKLLKQRRLPISIYAQLISPPDASR